MQKIYSKSKILVKTQVVAALFAVAAAVALPQLCHMLGAALGHGSQIGEMLLPMHLPIILVGMLAGPCAGAVAGALSPIVSFMLTGMPAATMLPIMVTELCAYGLLAGLIKDTKMPCLLKLLSVQLGGRLLRSLAVVAAVYVFNSPAVNISVIWTSITAGVWGILLQWIIIPLTIYGVNRASKNAE